MRLGLLMATALVIFSNTSVDAARSSQDSDVQNVRKKIKALEADIRITKKEVEALEEQNQFLKSELKVFEEEFQSRFSRILAPLLSWPSFPPMRKGLSWVEQEHLNLVLLQVREKIAREPLELISNRELMLRRVELKKDEANELTQSLEKKESLLRLQLEELEFLQKSSSRAKISKKQR